MTDPQTPPAGTSGPTVTAEPPPPPAAAPAKPPFDLKKCLGRLSPAEKILAVIGVLVVLGWILSGSYFWSFGLFKGWFPTLSFLGALCVVALIVLKAVEVKFLPPGLDRKVIAVASLLPVIGLLLFSMNSFQGFLTYGGSIALAYISAMTFWRKQIPQMKSLDEEAAPPHAGAGTPPSTPA